MTDINKLPLELYKANLKLQLKLSELLQNSGTQWIESGQRLAQEGSEGFRAELQQLLEAENWQALASQSASSFWRQMQSRFGGNQALAQVAVEAQTSFANELLTAVRAWQQQTAELVGGLMPMMAPLDSSAWNQLLRPWEQMMQAASQMATPAGKAPTRKEGR